MHYFPSGEHRPLACWFRLLAETNFSLLIAAQSIICRRDCLRRVFLFYQMNAVAVSIPNSF